MRHNQCRTSVVGTEAKVSRGVFISCFGTSLCNKGVKLFPSFMATIFTSKSQDACDPCQAPLAYRLSHPTNILEYIPLASVSPSLRTLGVLMRYPVSRYSQGHKA